ncbi:MAG TPA: AbrB/MazE/SpoVT family DNA-binding domain-containing protein [Kofleriaceae bacterium]
MIKKLTAIGNSYGLVIDKAILDLLKITPETELELTTDGVSLLVTPANTKKRVPEKSPTREPRREPAPKPVPKRPEPRYGFPKKQPW